MFLNKEKSFGILEKDENIYKFVLSSGTKNFDVHPGMWIGVGRNGRAYKVDHVAVLPPVDPGDDGTRPDAISSYAMVLEIKGANDPLRVATMTCVNRAGIKIKLRQSDLMGGATNSLHAGAALFVLLSGTNAGMVYPTTNAGDSYNAVVETVAEDLKSFTIRIESNTLYGITNNAQIAGQVIIDPAMDEDGDGVVRVPEIRKAALDINEDGHTNFQDVIKIVNDEAIN